MKIGLLFELQRVEASLINAIDQLERAQQIGLTHRHESITKLQIDLIHVRDKIKALQALVELED